MSCGVFGVCVNATCATLDVEREASTDVPDGAPAATGAPEAGVDADVRDATTVEEAGGGSGLLVDASPDAGVAESSACLVGQDSCGGQCVDTSSDVNNCGACGASCTSPQACSQALCVCATGATSCGGVCVDTSIDAANCGACGIACAAPGVCTGGSCAAATSDWPQFGYDERHAGENTAETDVPPAIDSWSKAINTNASALGPAAIEDGRAFVTYGTYFNAVAPVTAVDVSDGSALWTYNFGQVEAVGYPSVVGGTVYVQTNHGTMGDSYLWALDAASGSVTWAATFGSQWEHFWPPLVVGSRVYVDGGTYGGLYGFNTADGSQVFFNSGIGQYDSWSPAYFGSDLYTFIAGSFCSEDPTSGNVLSTTALTWNWTGYSMNTAPVFGPAFGYVISPPNLVAIDPAKSAAAWTANGAYSGTPAVASGVVYGISAGNLIARDAATGALQATLVGDASLKYPPVVAAGYVYASSDANVYAWNAATHAQVWTAPVGGWLTIAAHRLLVASSNGVLHGFVLSP